MRPLSIYIHVPFCKRSCPYCTFYRVPYSQELERKFVRTLSGEIENSLHSLGRSTFLRTIYFGGGTPSILGERSLELIFSVLAPYTIEEKTEEVTFELNPEDVTVRLLCFLRGIGVNRVSVGVQSMSDRAQLVLGRCGAGANDRALDLAREHFENVSVDLLLGIPGGSPRELARTLERTLSYEPNHFSVYCLEGNSENPAPAAEFFLGVDEDACASGYIFVCESLASCGYVHYEVSNFALPGFESRHNRVYWDGGEYLGVGPGAHSFLNGRRFCNESSVDRYLSASVGEGVWKRGVRLEEGETSYLERLMLGLRTNRGVAVEDIRGSMDDIGEMVKQGLGELRAGRFCLTDEGFLLLDEILSRLSCMRRSRAEFEEHTRALS